MTINPGGVTGGSGIDPSLNVGGGQIQTSSSKTEEVEQANLSMTTDTTSTRAAEEHEDQIAYQQSPAEPRLPVPGTGEEVVLQELFDPEALIEFMKSSDTTPDGPLTKEYKDRLAKVKVDDPKVVALAQKLGISPGEAQEKLQVTDQLYFEKLTRKLPDDEQEKLAFARAFPEHAKNLSPELKAKLAGINEAIIKEMVADLKGEGFTSDWKGVKLDTDALAESATDAFDSAFESQVDTLVKEGKLSKQEAAQVRTMHYITGSFADNSKLQSLFKEIEASALTSVQTQYGADATWTPAADTEAYQATINGAFQQEFMRQLDNFTPIGNVQHKLTQSEKNAIMDSFPDFDNLNMRIKLKGFLSLPLKKIAAMVMAKSVQATSAKFGLEGTWMPSLTAIINQNLLTGNLKTANDALRTATDIYDKHMEMANGMPEGSEKASFLDYLKGIGEALNELQEFINSLAASDSTISKKLSKASTDISIANSKKIQKKMADAARRARRRKKKFLGKLSRALGGTNSWIGKLTTLAFSYALAAVCMAVGAGPLATMIVISATANFVDQAQAEVRGVPTVSQKMFIALNDSFHDLGVANAGVLASFVSVMIAYTISFGNPFIMAQLVSDSSAVQELMGGFGASKSEQAIGAAVVNGVIDIALSVVLMMMGSPAASVHKALSAAGATEKTIKTVTTALLVTNAVLAVATGALETTNHLITAQWQRAQGAIAKLLADAEADSEEIKALIQSLKLLVNKLLEAMNGYADQGVSISIAQGKKYTDVSHIISQAQQG